MTQLQRYDIEYGMIKGSETGHLVEYSDVIDLIVKSKSNEKLLADLEYDHDVLVKKYTELKLMLDLMTAEEHKTSAAYVRIRELVGTMNIPMSPDRDFVHLIYEATEEKIRKLLSQK